MPTCVRSDTRTTRGHPLVTRNVPRAGWYGLWGPRGLPRDIAGRLQAEVAKAIRAADVRQKLPEATFDLVASTPEDFTRYVEEETAKYAAIVRRANITAE